MKRLLALLLLILTIGLIYLLDNDKHSVPGLGKMLSPTHGVWNNAPSVKRANAEIITLQTPDGKAEIVYDDRAVPHIFAPNEKALYYAQGYVQARDRLWQMDFQVRVAAGRLSEAIGTDGLKYDRYFRRLGISKAADEIVIALNEDPLYQDVVTSFTAGVNAYIDRLRTKDYPVEFKLANYKPDPWSLKKSVLLLKLMAFRLSGYDTDVSNSNTLKVMDMATYQDLFPDFPTDQSPIIPSNTNWDFRPVAIPEGTELKEFEEFDERDQIPNDEYSYMAPPIPFQKGIGSNNWAIGKDKTANGGAILCNDPHLGLTYPSIWYEMQLQTPELNVYGVTIPGSPCIIIGFNDDIAWGVTNGSRDVRDWYSVQYKDDSQAEYLFEGEYLPVQDRIETIKVKSGKDVVDTVKWTTIGPIVYDNNFGIQESTRGLAVRWLALDVSNELKTFYYMNKASNHSDYLEALTHYDNPAQNFVFADRKGNIAIKEQGKFRAKDRDDGKFIEPLEAQSMEKLNTFIPNEHNPHVYNPPRGFVSSANQNPTDSTYPYHYTGWFERYRNRRINYLLDSLDEITIDDMKLMQNDTYELMAKEMLPKLVGELDIDELSEVGREILDTLMSWNYFNSHYSTAPSYFQQWFKELKLMVWDELDDSTKFYRIPLDYETFEFVMDNPDHILIDNQYTEEKETVKSIINGSFSKMTDYFNGENATDPKWQFYNRSSIEHLMGLNSLGSHDLPTGGSQNSISANNTSFGPSWRMIIRLDDEGVSGYGVYPGGPSGNPGSPNYNSFVDQWAEGSYFRLKFYPSFEDAKQDLNTE